MLGLLSVRASIQLDSTAIVADAEAHGTAEGGEKTGHHHDFEYVQA